MAGRQAGRECSETAAADVRKHQRLYVIGHTPSPRHVLLHVWCHTFCATPRSLIISHVAYASASCSAGIGPVAHMLPHIWLNHVKWLSGVQAGRSAWLLPAFCCSAARHAGSVGGCRTAGLLYLTNDHLLRITTFQGCRSLLVSWIRYLTVFGSLHVRSYGAPLPDPGRAPSLFSRHC